MDSNSQSDEGGERHGGSPSLTGSTSVLHDDGSSHPPALQITNGLVDSGLNSRQRSHTPPLLSLVEIKTTSSSNEYTEGPTTAQRPQQQKTELVMTRGQQETLEERLENLHNLQSLAQLGNTSTSISSDVEDSQSNIRISVGSTSSGSRLFSNSASGDQIIRTQPKRLEIKSEELKPLNAESRAAVDTPRNTAKADKGKHCDRCEDCGLCRCPECTRPRELPSCWVCGGRCVCSANNVVENWTCVCCVKGIFYHCSNDDEDTCADKPFSCSQSHCCARWTTVTFLSLFLPCLICYLPAKGCVALCQCCYDRATRPGCRCKNSTPLHYQKDGKLI
uniref:Protein sprouty homolog 2 n=1 Tax=Iconisemion striatum TaxID=60296 RepID=A0A1A7WG00_9TELE